MDIQKMRDVDVTTVDPQTLIDIREIKVDGNLNPRKRKEKFIQQIRNPYCYRYGDYIVKIGFVDTETSLADRLEELILRAGCN